MMNEQRRIVAYLDGLQAKVNALRELRKDLTGFHKALINSRFCPRISCDELTF
jgi:hypothetical protein